MVRESYHIFVRVARFVPKDESGERHNPVRYSAFGSRKPSAERQSCRSAPRSGSERASTSSRFSLVAHISTDSGVFSTSPWLSMQTARCPSRASEDWLRPAELPADSSFTGTTYTIFGSRHHASKDSRGSQDGYSLRSRSTGLVHDKSGRPFTQCKT